MPEQLNSIPKVLLLGESEALCALERRLLREAGFTAVRVMTSGSQAIRIMTGITVDKQQFQPDLIVCPALMADMTGEQFCATLRLHPRLLGLPVLYLAAAGDTNAQLRALACGASAILPHPHDSAQLREQLVTLAASQQRLEQLARAAGLAASEVSKDHEEAIGLYSTLVKSGRQPLEYLRVGMQCLGQNRWGNALNAFQRAMRNAQIKAEAELGLAGIFRHGDTDRSDQWLVRSAQTFAQARKWHLARAVFARLAQDDPNGKTRFFASIRQLLRQKEYDKAVDALVAADLRQLSSQAGSTVQLCLRSLDTDRPEQLLPVLETSLDNRLCRPAASILTDQIRASLDGLARESEKRRQAFAERQWQARQQGKAEAGMPASGSLAENQGQAAGAGMGIALIESVADSVGEPEQESGGSPDSQSRQSVTRQLASQGGSEGKEVLATLDPLGPMTEDEARSGMFTCLPIVNELLSVIKCTWKLDRRNKIKDKGK